MATLGTATTLPWNGYGVSFLVLDGFIKLFRTHIIVLDSITIGLGLWWSIAGRR